MFGSSGSSGSSVIRIKRAEKSVRLFSENAGYLRDVLFWLVKLSSIVKK